MSGITIAVLLVAVGVGTCVIAAMARMPGPTAWVTPTERPGPGEWCSDLGATEALTGMIDTTTPTVTMKRRRRRANQPGVLVQRPCFFYDEHTPSGITLNHREPHLGKRCCRGNQGVRTWPPHRWGTVRPSPLGQRGRCPRRLPGRLGGTDPHLITVAETKHNPLPPTLS